MPPNDDIADLRARAWVGDAVLALYAREWILAREDIKPADRSEEFIRMTANDFLGCVGEPTKVEAGIGDIYRNEGLQAAFAYIEQTLLPLYLKQRNNRR
ncbi:hypothetical protein [Cerasicoccus fimbriatus]|uniref:hypothetical protein n=1 Tax=Cerasicoccus fimbriatus TaxID=3014554 RepID=UPI0022B5273F|nr:hypothetical protein [Cerasicoccus sp. TK19100]